MATLAAEQRHVLFVVPNVGFSGGMEHQLLLLIQHLDPSWRVTVAHLYPLATLAEQCRQAGATVIGLGMRTWWDPRGIWRLWRLLHRERFDIVHAFLFDAVVVACPLARWAGVPVVISSRRNLDDWMSWWHVQLVRMANRHADAVTVNAEALKTFVVQRERISTDRVVVISNALDPASAHADPGAVQRVREELRLGADERLVCAVGNLKPAKGYPDLLEAATLVVQRAPNTRFVIVGDGAMAAALQRQAGSLGLNGRLQFVGRRTDARAFLAAADVCAFASHREGQSNVMLEAMALGVPVVATAVGGTPELIENRRAGRVVPPRNSIALAQAIVELLVNRDQAKAMAEHAKRTVHARFPLSAMVEAHQRLYRQLLERHSPRA